jgi:transposase InsO family protein
MIDQLKPDYPVAQLCHVLGCPRSSYYDRPQPRDEQTLVSAIERILMKWPFYGYRRLVAQLRREGVTVGERVVRRILRELGISHSVGKVRVRTTDSNHAHRRYPNRIKELTITRPDQVWVADITYIRLGTRFIYLAVILDAYTRAARGWYLSRRLAQDLTVTALHTALEHGTPFIFHSDQGSQYACWLHTEVLLNAGVHISMSDTGEPTQNGLVERFMRTVKEEHVDYADYRDFDDAFGQLEQWLEVEYMTERVHSALDYLTPAEFEAAALAQWQPLLNNG